ncbi:Gfo/Idh/MocA family oxidoreductase [Candidatus Dependentiae bacterium]|nr:Gfo/Idh/MocA family oxidoreductase [Candidatus Dependentiae bacterium]
MEHKKIVIIGCGQLGSRHLQSLLNIDKFTMNIDVVEPNEKNTQTAITRISEANQEFLKNRNIKIEWYTSHEKLENSYDLAIVATTAAGRKNILLDLLKLGIKCFLIEKMVCQSEDEFKTIIKAFKKNEAKGWINCTRRYFPFYAGLIEKFKTETKIYFNVISGNHGLGCNAVHFIDLFYALCGDKGKLNLEGEYLSQEILKNQRGTELSEFSGVITGKINENFCSVQFHSGNMVPVQIEILSDNYRIKIDESKNSAYIFKILNGLNSEEVPFNIVYTSQLTSMLAEEILLKKESRLPDLEKSFVIHKELFKIFNSHIKKVTGIKKDLCPIT